MHYMIMTNVPAVIKIPAIIVFKSKCSPKIMYDKTSVITILDLSIGATFETSPKAMAL